MIPRPATPAHTAIARPRFLPSNTLVTMDSVAGIISAPPTPITAVRPIKVLAESEKAAATEPAPKTTSPTVSASFRPNDHRRHPW